MATENGVVASAGDAETAIKRNSGTPLDAIVDLATEQLYRENQEFGVTKADAHRG